MQPLFILIICIIAISVIVIAMVRTRLKNKSKELSEKLSHIFSYKDKSNYEQAKERLSALNDAVFVDIPTDLSNKFHGKIISATQEIDFINHILKKHIHLPRNLKHSILPHLKQFQN